MSICILILRSNSTIMSLNFNQIYQQIAPTKREPNHPVQSQNLSKSVRIPQQKKMIVVSSDQDEDQILKKKQEDQFFMYEIGKARLSGSPFHLLMTVTKEFMPGNQAQKSKLFREMIIRYFLENLGLNIESGFFQERFDSGLGVDAGRVYDSRFLLYGTDFYTTSRMFHKYSRYTPRILRINGSHCLLEFPSFAKAEEFFMANVKDFQTQSLVPFPESPTILARRWTELNTYLEIIFIRPLFIRNLTELDERIIKMSRCQSSDITRYEQAKEQLLLQLEGNQKVKRVIQILENNEKLQRERYESQKKASRYFSNRNCQSQRRGPEFEQRHRDRSRTRQKAYQSQPSNNYPYHQRRDNQKFNSNNNYQPNRNQKKRTNAKTNANNKISTDKQQQNQLDKSITYRIEEGNQSKIYQHFHQVEVPPENKATNQIVPSERSNLQESQASSSAFRQLQSQLNRFNMNSNSSVSYFSSIAEKSKHHLSQVKFLDEHRLNSNNSSNILSSNQPNNVPNDLSILEEDVVDQKFTSRNFAIDEESEDEDIYQMFQIPRTSKSSQIMEKEPDLRMPIRPLDYNEVMKIEQEVQVQEIEKSKTPRKKLPYQAQKPKVQIELD